jgi:hypothetical protein
MADVAVEDLLALNREVARAARALDRWRADVAAEAAHAVDAAQAADAASEPIDPFQGVRRASAKSTWDALGALNASALDAPLRDALRRWVAALLLARIGLSDESARARAAAARSVRLEGDAPREESWATLWRSVVSARTADEARRWLAAGAPAAEALAAPARERAARRAEASRRLGHEHPWTAVAGVAPAAVRSAAMRLLDATEDVGRHALREALGREADAGSAIHLAVAREAGHGWPAHLTKRWLEDVMGSAAARLSLRLPALPPPLGAASFARALRVFGRAARLGVAPAAGPFALAREPAFVAAHRWGAVFGALPAEPDFQTRVLGLSRRLSSAQARVLARTALLEARFEAARTLLSDDAAFAAADAFDELGARVFGAPLDRRYRGAWPAARDDDPAPLLGLLGALAQREELRERFDVDWFRNPRAWAHLRADAARPAFEPLDEKSLPDRAAALGRAFEQALG